MEPPRILVISRNLPPLIGGMERLSLHLIESLSGDYVCEVIGPTGSVAYLPQGTMGQECRFHRPAAFLAEAAVRALVLSHARERPLVILATSGLTAPIAYACARMVNATSAVCVHGLDLVADNVVYQSVFLPAIRRTDLVVANSANTRRIAVSRGVDEKRVTIVHPGVSWPQTLPDGAPFRVRHDLVGKKVILAVGRFTRRKGLPEFIDRSFAALARSDPNWVLVIVGDEASDAIRSERSVRALLDQAVARQGIENQVRMVGFLGDRELGEAYTAADLHVFPLIAVTGDVEGFGMVAAEAAAHGLPTLAFDEGGVGDAIVEGVTGRLIASGDYESMSEAIRAFLRNDGDNQWRRECREAARQFSWEIYAARIREAIGGSLRRKLEGRTS